MLLSLRSRGRRAARSSAPHPPEATARVWLVASVLLDHPDDDLVARVPALRTALAGVPDLLAGGLVDMLDLLESGGVADLQREYVDTFDLTRRCALHLTYATCGDTRRRGVELVRFKQAYREAGVEFSEDASGGELPDHLAAVLQLGGLSATGELGEEAYAVAWRLLTRYRVSLELLRRALAAHRPTSDTFGVTPWLDVVDAVRATLPPLAGGDEEAIARLVAQGPPGETVGLDDAPAPYDPQFSSFTPDEPTFLGASIPVGAAR